MLTVTRFKNEKSTGDTNINYLPKMFKKSFQNQGKVLFATVIVLELPVWGIPPILA